MIALLLSKWASTNYSIFIHLLRNPSTPSHEISPTITHSPAKVQPSSSLSLSEPEDETRKPKVPLLPPSSFEVKISIFL